MIHDLAYSNYINNQDWCLENGQLAPKLTDESASVHWNCYVPGTGVYIYILYYIYNIYIYNIYNIYIIYIIYI